MFKLNKEELLIGLGVATVTYLIVSNSSKNTRKSYSVSKSIVNADKYSQFTADSLNNARKLESLAFGPYKWKGTSGMPIDIYFKSQQPLFTKPSDGSTYCTGYTFSVAFVTCLNRGLLNHFTDADIRKMQEVWNLGDAKTYPKLCVDAISKPLASNLKPLGKEISIENVQPGDFCQIWRTSGSGHSVIVVDMIKKDGKIIGIKYYSSNGTVNPTTKKTGPGENTEYFSDSGGKMIRKNTYYARLNQ
jgi:hypothetical protein